MTPIPASKVAGTNRQALVAIIGAVLVCSGSTLLALAAANPSSAATATLTLTSSSPGVTCDDSSPTQPICSGLAGGDVLNASGAGFTPSTSKTADLASLIECNSDPSQSVIYFLGNDIPVSCSSLAISQISTTGTFDPPPYTVHAGTVGPPINNASYPPKCYDSAPIAPGSSTTTTTPISGCTTSGSATTDAASYPCPPTAAQQAKGDTCVLAIGDQDGDRAVGILLFGNETLPTSTTTTISGSTTTTGPTTTTTSTTTTTTSPTQSSTSSQVSAGTIALDASGTVSDTVTVQGTATYGAPAGTITFYMCQISTDSTLVDGPCAPVASNEAGQAHLTAGTNNASSATSSAFTPTAAGTWCFSATFTPSDSYQPSADNTTSGNVDRNECVLVSTYPSTTQTFVSAVSVTLGPNGTVSDTVVVNGNTTGGPPTGHVAFYVCQTAASQTLVPGPCAGAGAPEDPLETLIPGAGIASSATSVPFTPDRAGTWCFSAVYSGDSNYQASTDNTSAANIDSGECVLVGVAGSTAASTVSTPDVALGPTGTVTDKLTVTGNSAGGSPTGAVVFYACQTGTTQTLTPGACATTSPPEDNGETLAPATSDTAAATSAPFTPDALGTWCFSAVYSGDSNYVGTDDNTSSANLDPGECVLVGPGHSVLTTSPSAGMFVLGESAPITDIATVAGNSLAGMPAGSVDFYVCGPLPADATCTSVSSPEGTPTLAPEGADMATATSSAFSPPTPGIWCFAAEFQPSAGVEYVPTTDNVSVTDASECIPAYNPYTFISSASLTVTGGATIDFPVQTVGTPAASITKTGRFPIPIGYQNGHDNSGLIHGLAKAKKAGTYSVTFRAVFGKRRSKVVVTQVFTLTILP